jgi:galactokinase
VTPDALTDRLLAAGFEPDDAAARAALCLRAATALARHAGRPARWGWFVPGRIEVFGKHTDYAGGRSLVAAVPRGFAVAASPRDDGIVSVVDARWRDAVDVDPLDDTRTFKGWTNYVAVVARRLADNFRGAPLGADLVIASDLPRAAGLSSSSALVVGLALALIRRAALDAAPAWRASIRSGFDLGGYLGAVENGLTFGGLAGTGGVGTHGGSQDHNAILNGRPGQVSAYAYLPVRHLADAALPADWRFIVLSSGIRADKAGSVRARYNRASLATRALVELGQRLGPAPEAGASGAGPATLAAMLTEPGRVEALASLAAAGHGAFTGEELTRRLRHFVAEDGRVLPAADAVRRRDAAALGVLSAASQHDADRLLDNQIDETRQLAALARGSGAFAASSFGAGFGGSVWALALRDEAVEVAERWRRAYRRAFPEIGDVEWFITRPSPGAVELFAVE